MVKRRNSSREQNGFFGVSMFKKQPNIIGIRYNRTMVPICDFCHAKEGEKHKVGHSPVVITTIDVLGTNKNACLSCARICEEILLQKNTQMDECTQQKLWEIAKRF